MRIIRTESLYRANSEIIARGYRVQLINNATQAEQHLRQLLIKHLIKFEFQKIVLFPNNFFIVDFFIHLKGNKHLVVELDGASHNTPAQRDKDNLRAWHLRKRKHYEVLRIDSDDYLSNPARLIEKIMKFNPKPLELGR